MLFTFSYSVSLTIRNKTKGNWNLGKAFLSPCYLGPFLKRERFMGKPRSTASTQESQGRWVGSSLQENGRKWCKGYKGWKSRLSVRASEVTQQVRVPTDCQPEDQLLIPETHVVERTYSCKLSSDSTSTKVTCTWYPSPTPKGLEIYSSVLECTAQWWGTQLSGGVLA